MRLTDFLNAHMRSLLNLALVGALLVAVLLLGRSWFEARDARVRLEATLEAQRQAIAAAEQREQQRAHQLATALAQITELKKTVRTPEQVVRELPRYLPPLPKPVEIKLPEPPAKPIGGEEPPPAIVQVPQVDLKPLFDFVQDCRACQLQLAAAQADLHDEHDKIAALARERDAAVKAARGGGFWSRLKHGAKWFVLGGAVGAALAAASR